jgi:hypothetical protein
VGIVSMSELEGKQVCQSRSGSESVIVVRESMSEMCE